VSERTSGATYLLATRSAGKLRELRELLAPYGMRLIDLTEAGLPEDPREADIEAFDTFEANARAKAEYFFGRTGLPTFADDSGLAIHALNGAPGVRSKRWSGRDELAGEALDAANNMKLVTSLATLDPDIIPTAEYVCAAAFKDDTRELVALGRTEGTMLVTPRGANGFGYDPYFLSAELGQTFGEARAPEKHAISHRGRAFTALLEAMGMK
jgi:XTP/dITP diphosphohydrolase